MKKIRGGVKQVISNGHLAIANANLMHGLNLPLRSLIIALCAVFFHSNATAKANYVSIGTGGISGVYYPTGGAICFLVNQLKGIESIRCEIKSTPGSIHNLNVLKARKLDIAVVQSDWQYHVYNGTSIFKEVGKFTQLRSLFSVHSEPFTVLARKDAKITSFEQLKGKRVNIGAPNSGQRGTMKMLLDIYGWQESDFAEATSLPPSEQAQALCDNKVDAIVYVVGHPNSSIKEASSACQTNLVNVEGQKVSQLIATHSYYDKASISAKMYRGSPKETTTFGVGATVVTTTDLPEQIAYDMVKAVFENHRAFVQLHPSFEFLTKHAMVTQYLSAPLHSGALRYYKEVGLIRDDSSTAHN